MDEEFSTSMGEEAIIEIYTSNETYQVQVNLHGTVDDLIERNLGVVPFLHRVPFTEFFLNGVLLDKQHTLAENGVTCGSKLYRTESLCPPSTDSVVFINTARGITWEYKTAIKGKSQPTVLEVKKMLQQKEKVPIDRIYLLCRGKKLLDEDPVFNYINSQNYAVFHLYLRPSGEMCVKVCMGNRKYFNILLYPDYTVCQFKESIERTTGTPVKDQVLYHNGMEMKDFVEVRHYHIQDCDEVKLCKVLNVLGRERIRVLEDLDDDSSSESSIGSPDFEVIGDEELSAVEENNQVEVDISMLEDDQTNKMDSSLKSEDSRPSLKGEDYVDRWRSAPAENEFPKLNNVPKEKIIAVTSLEVIENKLEDDRLGFKKQLDWFSKKSNVDSYSAEQQKRFHFQIPDKYSFKPKSSYRNNHQQSFNLFRNFPGVDVFMPKKKTDNEEESVKSSGKFKFDIPDVDKFRPSDRFTPTFQSSKDASTIEANIEEDIKKLRLFSGIDNSNVRVHFYNSQPFEITIKTLEDKNYKVVVNALDLVKDLKTKLVEETGMPIWKQRLIFDGTELENVWSLAHYDVSESDLLYLVSRKKNAAERIYVQNILGEILRIKVQPNEMITSVKLRIASQIGVDYKKQRLFFGGTELNNILRLTNYDIKNDDVLEIKIM